MLLLHSPHRPRVSLVNKPPTRRRKEEKREEQGKKKEKKRKEEAFVYKPLVIKKEKGD